jgi:Ras-related GTP-binding protein C/D
MHVLENVRHIQQRVIDELLDTLQEYEQMVNFHLTSVEAFTRTSSLTCYRISKLNVFCSVCASSPSSAFPTGA